MVKPVKHQDTKIFDNKAGIYLTCNELPDFGVKQSNVDRRISVFHTTELPEPKCEAPQCIDDNITESFICMINEINGNTKYSTKRNV